MAGLIGGLGFAPAANVGTNVAVFEAVHGSAPDIAGRGVANPTALLLAGCMLLEHIGQREPAGRIRAALDRVVRGGEARTRDMGGSAGTRDFATALIAALD
jgi:isocitrate dehydrogenase (NAD+)